MMKKPKMGSNEQQASHAVQASESSVQRLHVRLSSTTVFKRKARNISEPHGDLEIVQIMLRRPEASQLGAAAALVRARGHHRYTGQLYGRASGPLAWGGKTTVNLKPLPRLSPPVSAAQSADMRAVRAILRRLLKPEAVDRWLNTEIPALDQRKPVDVIRHGGIQQVIEVLARVEEGIPM